MFGGTFGAFGTAGCHFFDRGHPTYRRIAAINRVRQRPDQIGLALRRGRQYPRETSFLGGPFSLPGKGELVAWSRIFRDQEVLVALNTHGAQSRGADVTVDASLHRPGLAGSVMTVLYDAAWNNAQLRSLRGGRTVPIQVAGGRATVRIDLPPAGMVILA